MSGYLRYYQKRQKKTKNGTDIVSIIPAWKQLTKAFRGVSPHSFYRELPYEVLEERKKRNFKKHCIGNEKMDAK